MTNPRFVLPLIPINLNRERKIIKRLESLIEKSTDHMNESIVNSARTNLSLKSFMVPSIRSFNSLQDNRNQSVSFDSTNSLHSRVR
jgi:hypothetical protein